MHISPSRGGFELVDLNPIIVRRWFSELFSGTIGPTTAAKCHRLLRTILAMAVANRRQVRGGEP